MSDRVFDPGQYKAGQQKQWDSVADGWRKWWPTIEAFSQPVSDRFMELADIGPGQTILDIATGIGEPAITAAKRVGSSGKVFATDQSEGMLQIARDRAAEAGLDNIEFLATDAESLDFGEGIFDAATCRWGLMFMPDLEAALQAIRRALKPGGKLVASVWGPPEKAIGVSLALGVAQRVLELPPLPVEAPSMFKLAAPGAVDGAVSGAGFSETRSESMTVNFQYESAEEYVAFFKDIAAPVRLMLANQPPEKGAQVWQAIAAEAGKLAQPDGRLSLPSETLITVGRK